MSNHHVFDCGLSVLLLKNDDDDDDDDLVANKHDRLIRLKWLVCKN